MADRPSAPSYAAGTPDFVLLLAVAGLLGIGVVMVYSSSFYLAEELTGDHLHFLKRELLNLALGLVAMGVAYLLPPRFWARRLGLLFPLALGLLVILILPSWLVGPLVPVWQGARRWLNLGVISLQPSELMKPVLVIFLARLMDRPGAHRDPWRRITLPGLTVIGLVFLLIFLQPNFSTAAIIAMTGFLMLMVGGAPWYHLVPLAALALPVGYWLLVSEDYRARRLGVASWLNPWLDPTDSGYHVIQGLYAIGAGGWFGVGLGRSRQKLGWLPEQYGDWIFAVLAEELGFVGAVTVILLFALFVWRGYRVALRAPDRYCQLVAFGLTTFIGIQSLINIAVVTATFMPTGVPLPFITYGGSSLAITLMDVGILLAISRLRAPATAPEPGYPPGGYPIGSGGFGSPASAGLRRR
ncbi:MAG: putative lipid II flippase FtsW [Bacillota bacterium]|nr:MAG: putative lipid II flippase FtsW [Bacillota bacterium]